MHNHKIHINPISKQVSIVSILSIVSIYSIYSIYNIVWHNTWIHIIPCIMHNDIKDDIVITRIVQDSKVCVAHYSIV